MAKKIIKLTEGDLHKIIKTSVGKILKEINLKSWVENNNSTYKQAVDVLSKYVIERLGPEDILDNPDIVEDEVEDSWQDVLSDDLLEAIYDKYDVACVTNKSCYGGGGFEVLRELQMDVRDNVLNILKNGQSN